jgi:hypothetical protein
MTRKNPKNAAASVRQRLLNLSRQSVLVLLARSFAFSGSVLRDAIAATFQRRGTAVRTELPIALTDSFAKDKLKLTQWNAFVRRNGLEGRTRELGRVVGDLAEFLGPPMIAVATGQGFERQWEPSGPWRSV